MAANNPRRAIFIDCENADPNLARAFFLKHPHLANANIKRAYGDCARLQGWLEVLKEHLFQPILTPPSAKRANATDFAIVIDCLDLLHARGLNEAWLVTSDADFTQLAMHLRSHDVKVIGVGDERTLVTFRTACSRFVDYKPKPIQPSAVSKPKVPRQDTANLQ